MEVLSPLWGGRVNKVSKGRGFHHRWVLLTEIIYFALVIASK